MALLSKKDQADDGESAASAKGVASKLKALEERGFSGAVEVGVKGSSARAQIYLYEGGIYAVHLDGYGPVLMDRLATQGILDSARWTELAAIFGPHRSHPRVGPTAVEQEWMTLDELVNVHQEFLIASLGAVLAVSKARVERETNATTGAFCSLPQDLPRLLRLVQGRQQRIASAWAAIEARCEPAELVLRRGSATIPSNLDHDEFVAVLERADGERSLDEIAAATGLTRGEAMRAASLLVLAGVLAVDPDRRAQAPDDRLLVPEAWGRSLVPRSEPDLPAPAPRAAPVGAVAAGTPDGPPAWLPRRSTPAVVVEPRESWPVTMTVAEAGPMPEPTPAPEPANESAYESEHETELELEHDAAPEPEPSREWLPAEPLDRQQGEWAGEPDLPIERRTEESVGEPEPWAPEVREPRLGGLAAADESAVEVSTPEVSAVDSESAADALLLRHRRLQEATEQALLLEQLLSESIEVEREALERSSVLRQRLRATLAQVASLTSAHTADSTDAGDAVGATETVEEGDR